MKKLLLLLAFVLMIFVGCNKANDQTNNSVAITTDIDVYTPAMSSAQGITMTPNFKTDQKNSGLVFHWSTDEGEFIGLGRQTENHGESVTWTAISNNEVANIESSFDIRLEVFESKSQKVLAKAKLRIQANNGFYKVQK